MSKVNKNARNAPKSTPNNRNFIIAAVAISAILLAIIIVSICCARSPSSNPANTSDTTPGTTRHPLDSAAIVYTPKTDDSGDVVGYIYSKDWSGAANIEGDVTIPAEWNGRPVIGITSGVFAGSKVTKITIPGTVKVIEAGTFAKIPTLKAVILNEGVEIVKTSAFYDCAGLEEIILPSTIKYFASSAVDSTKWLNTRLDGAVYIDLGAGDSQNGCIFVKWKGEASSVTSFSIKEGTKIIADNALYNQNWITSLSLPSTLVSIGSEAFVGTSIGNTITLPSGVIGVAYNAFRGSGVKTLKLTGNMVIQIYGEPILDCSTLEKIIFPDNATKTLYAAYPIWDQYVAKFFVE